MSNSNSGENNYYVRHGQTSAASFDTVDPEELYEWMKNYLPENPAVVLDVGAGSGRDAEWLAKKGHHVIAVEPSHTMREHAARYHANQQITWLNDSMPSLDETYKLNYAFDVVLVNAVWMFVPARERIRAFRKLVDLIKPGGLLVISAQIGVDDPVKGKIPVAYDELPHLATQHGLKIEKELLAPDVMQRDYQWQQLVIRIPDDGTGAMPFLRRLVLDDRKAATYKLGLLRTVIRIAESSSGFARVVDDGQKIELPLGLLGLYWLKLYFPLTQADMPQSAANRKGGDALSFAGAAYQALPSTIVADLFLGNTFSGDRAKLLTRAIRDACDCIEKMPATFTTYDDEGKRKVFEIQKNKPLNLERIQLNDEYFSMFGTVTMSRHIWMSIARFGFWVEPSVVLEWSRLMHAYAAGQGRQLNQIQLQKAMEWTSLERDQTRARSLVADMHRRGHQIRCVWTNKRIDDTYDIDHILPWAAWPCGDLWNLVPVDRTVNQAHKRAKLVSAALLDAARERLDAFWTHAYLEAENEMVCQSFYQEADASLGIQSHTLKELHTGIRHRRTQLRIDQAISEFTAPKGMK